MATDATSTNMLVGKTDRVGDVPDGLRRRYFVDEKGGPGVSYYVDARVREAAFRDQGRVLATGRADPDVVRDMIAIARHRQWTIVVARGSPAFRREAWIAGRMNGLEVRGYRPTERDLQDLARRTATRSSRAAEANRDRGDRPVASSAGGRSRLGVVEGVVRARISDPLVQERVLKAARARVADWLERGAQFSPLRTDPARADRPSQARRERQRS